MPRSSKVRTRKRGKTYSYIFEAGRSPDGKRKVVEKGGFGTESDAYDAGIAAYNDWKHGNIGITSDRITVAEYLNAWLNAHKNDIVSTTKQNYAINIQRITKYIGNIILQDLTPRNVDTMVNQMYKDGYSYGTINISKGTLHLALKYAVYPAELISNNPAEYISVPKKAPQNIIKREIISQERLSEIMQSFPKGNPIRIPILIAYHTGMRIGEILGLTWDAVNLKEGTISVVQQRRYTLELKEHIAKPKTKTSIRSFLIDKELIRELKYWKSVQASNEIQQGDSYVYTYVGSQNRIFQMSKSFDPQDGWHRQHFVCTNKNGKFIPRDVLRKRLRAYKTNPHSFRHTHATMLIEGNAIPKDVAARLGHADATITQNLYTHDTPEMQKNTLSIFENMLAQNALNADKK